MNSIEYRLATRKRSSPTNVIPFPRYHSELSKAKIDKSLFVVGTIYAQGSALGASASHLEARCKQPVSVVFSGAVAQAIREESATFGKSPDDWLRDAVAAMLEVR